MNECHEHHIEFLESGEDTPEALESAKQTLDLVAALVHFTVVLPGRDSIRLRWHDRDETQIQCQLPGLVAFVGTVHQQLNRPTGLAQSLQERAALGRIVRLAWRKREGDGGSSIRGNQMNLGSPSAAGLANGLWAVFFSAPVPSG